MIITYRIDPQKLIARLFVNQGATYPGVDRGFAFPRRATCHQAAAGWHWAHLRSLFNGALAPH
jgi:hypothetical protein